MTTQETVTSNEAEQPPQPETVSVLAKARDEWLETAEGMRAEDTSTLIHSGDPDYYQRSRLSAAFFAGVNWMFRELTEAKHLHCETIEQRTNCIGELERLRAACKHLLAFFKSQHPEAFKAGGGNFATDFRAPFELDLAAAKAAIKKATK